MKYLILLLSILPVFLTAEKPEEKVEGTRLTNDLKVEFIVPSDEFRRWSDIRICATTLHLETAHVEGEEKELLMRVVYATIVNRAFQKEISVRESSLLSSKWVRNSNGSIDRYENWVSFNNVIDDEGFDEAKKIVKKGVGKDQKNYTAYYSIYVPHPYFTKSMKYDKINDFIFYY